MSVETVIANLKATARKLAGSTPLDVAIVDGSGNQVTSFGGTGGTSSDFGSTFPAQGTAAGAKDSGGNMAPLNLDGSGNLKIAGSLTTTPPAAGTSTLSNVSAASSNTTILSSNSSRLGFMLANEADKIAYVKLGSTASPTSYTRALLPGDKFSTQDLGVNYTGRIDAIWESSVSGTMRVTELAA